MRFIGLLIVVIVAIGGYTGYWFYLTHTIETAVRTWQDTTRGDGMAVETGPLEYRGFPYRLVTHAPRPTWSIDKPNDGTELQWQAPPFEAVVQPWQLRHVIFHWPGRHRLQGQFQSHPLNLAIEADAVNGSYRYGAAGQLERLSVTFADLSGQDTSRHFSFSAASGDVHIRPSADAGSFEIAGQIPALHLATEPALLMGPDWQNLRLEASLTQPLPSDVSEAGIARWQQSGGEIKIRRFSGQWGSAASKEAIDINASGRLHLDTALYLNGELEAKIANHGLLLNALVRNGQIAAEDRGRIDIALTLLAVANGGVLNIPVLIKNGWVHAGPFKLFRLPPLYK